MADEGRLQPGGEIALGSSWKRRNGAGGTGDGRNDEVGGEVNQLQEV